MGEWSEGSMKSVQNGMTVAVSCNYFIQILLCSVKRLRISERKYFLFKEQLNCLCYCYRVYRCRMFLHRLRK